MVLQRKQKTWNERDLGCLLVFFLLYTYSWLYIPCVSGKNEINEQSSKGIFYADSEEDWNILNVECMFDFISFYIFISGNSRSYQQWMNTVKV